MQVYDKAVWHIDNGEEEKEVLKRFELIFDFLAEHKMLNEEGKELYGLGPDESWAFYDRILTDAGKQFMEKQYDRLLVLNLENLQQELKTLQ